MQRGRMGRRRPGPGADCGGLRAAVAADAALGKTYTSFMFTAVKDANGTPLDGSPEYFYLDIYGGSDPNTGPRLDMNTIVPPSVKCITRWVTLP